MNEQPQRSARRLNVRRLALVAAAMVLGLLLWARVIVIARMPRLAVAENEGEQASAQVTPPADASSGREGDASR
ncbi:MAG: hypothetical protein ACYTJ0_05245 [Planctomycetota bacterium]